MPARKDATPSPPPLTRELLTPGLRLGVAVSSGADSVALLRLLHGERERLGLVLTVLHVHHGLRGAEADEDACFVRELAVTLSCAALEHAADISALARQRSQGLEETAREARYGWFSQLLDENKLDAVATAHTLDDQAETVLHRLLRGAWTEGLGGIHPVVRQPGGGRILRPLLTATRSQIIAWLGSLDQPWREDSSNRELRFTRNRIRHQLLPELATYNPSVKNQLAQLAEIARDEEAYWDAEVARTLPGLVLPGRAVRGGGRATSTHPNERSLAFEVERLSPLPPALVRRLLRAAALQLGAPLDFDQTARAYQLLQNAGTTTGRNVELTAQLHAERTPRELRLLFSEEPSATTPAPEAQTIPIPGEGSVNGWHVRVSWSPGTNPPPEAPQTALLRPAKPGDRVHLRHSRGAPKKVKEVLERLGISPADRLNWPVLEYAGEIIWLAQAVLEPTMTGLNIDARHLL